MTTSTHSTQHNGGEQLTLLQGGFPCQPYSVAGHRKGTGDDRALWSEMLRVITECRPTWVLGENVAGIVTMELDTVLSDLEDAGYTTRAFALPACAVDAPHRRDRIWIVANADKSGSPGRNGAQLPERANQESAGKGGTSVANSGVGWTNEFARWEPEPLDVARRAGETGLHGIPESLLDRVAHGIPNRSHRLRALGNAVVPQVAEEIFRAMKHVDNTTNGASQ